MRMLICVCFVTHFDELAAMLGYMSIHPLRTLRTDDLRHLNGIPCGLGVFGKSEEEGTGVGEQHIDAAAPTRPGVKLSSSGCGNQ